MEGLVNAMRQIVDVRSLWSTTAALAAAAFAALAATSGAHAQQLEAAPGIWCDKAEQVESLVRSHLGDGLALEAALAKTNSEAHDPGACVAAMAIVAETRVGRRFVAGNQMVAITEYVVYGVMKNGQPVQIPPQVWFAAKVVAKLTAI